MPKDQKGIDDPKKHPGPAGDPRRRSTKGTPEDGGGQSDEKAPKSPPEGYAEEQPTKSAARPPKKSGA